MSTKIRKQVYVKPEQESLLKRLSASTGLSEAEIVREALDRYLRMLLREQEARTAWQKERAYLEERSHLVGSHANGAAGQPETEIIRQTIDHSRSMIIQKRDPRAWEELLASMIERGKKGPLPGHRTWRREDLYER